MRASFRWPGLAAVTAALVAALGLLTAAPAAAHDRLLQTTPAAGATVVGPPAAVVLQFNEPVQARFATVVVTGSDHAEHQSGPAAVAEATVRQSVTALPNGPVLVAWRVVSADGHPVSGTFTFRVAGSANVTPSASPSAVATTPAAAAPTDSTPGSASGGAGGGTGWIWLVVAAALVAAAVANVLVRRRRAATGSDPGSAPQ